MSLLNALNITDKSQTAIVYKTQNYSYQQLINDVNTLCEWLVCRKVKSVCINMSNCYEWVVVDLACQQGGIMCIPVPQFFSQQQSFHLLEQTQADVILGSPVTRLTGSESRAPLGISAYFRLTTKPTNAPKQTSKITFTSGSTGEPKGVCLSVDNQLKVANSLVKAIGISEVKHLVLLPLATLLENIAGVYAPILAGGQVVIPSDEEKGFVGSRLALVDQLLQCITLHRPDSMILVPELLHILIEACKHGWQAPSSLRFVAVGGAKVDAALIKIARQHGLPVFQGYGLSECASVVSICTNLDAPANSVGKVLGHACVKLKNDEVIVSGNCFLGYLNEPSSWYPEYVSTGDLGVIKKEYLFVNGRNKNLLVNSFGRNISPEWVESIIAGTGLFRQNIVLGEARPYLCALLVPMSAHITKKDIQAAINHINLSLPDYARVLVYMVLSDAFSTKNGLLTENGKLKRVAIETYYSKQIEQQYSLQSQFAMQESQHEII